MPASYFDVDGTLVRTNLVHPTFYSLQHQVNPWRSIQMLTRAFVRGPAMAIAELQDRRRFNEMLYASFQGMSVDRMRLLAEEIAHDVLLKNMYPGARDLVQRCIDLGYEVVLVSGTLHLILEHFAKAIGAHTIIANRLEVKEYRLTGKMLRPIVAGPEKSLLIRRHAAQQRHDLNQCHAFSDSYSDVPMLSVVGHPAAVNPGRKLRRLARTYQWPILHLDHALSCSNGKKHNKQTIRYTNS